MTRRPLRDSLHAMITNSLEVAAAQRSAPAPELAVRVSGVHKTYGDVRALNGVALDVRRGEVLALLGPNGAGKTTLVEILEGHRRADDGDVSVLGFDPGRRERAFRERVGIVLQEEGLDPRVTVGEAVELYGGAYPHPRPAAEVLELVGLGDRGEVPARDLSGGQRRRLDLALGIVGDPDLIFLDEPTTGFDPAARRQSWELIAGLRALGTTIVLTTHYMEEAQRLADRVVVIAHGEVIAAGTPESLAGDHTAVVSFRLRHEDVLGPLPLPADAVVDRGERRVRFRTDTPTRDLTPVLAWATERGVELDELSVTRPSLEDVYLQLTTEEAA
jgi:ABC-2 type transport system ATP-binding protein